MPVPKKRTSSSRRGMRRSHHGLKQHFSVIICPNCGETMLRHRACAGCGQYRGRSIVPTEATS